MNEISIEAALDYCRRYPVPKVDAERFLRHLSTPPNALVDMRDVGWLGVVLNRALDVNGATPFEWIGAETKILALDLAARALQEIGARAKAMSISAVHILMTPAWAGTETALREAGASPIYHDLDMSHADGEWGDDVSLPEGWRWVGFEDSLGQDYVELLRRSFGDQPGFYMPSEEEVLRGLRETAAGTRILIDENGIMRAIMRCRPEKRYIHAIARDPDCRGLGLGRLAMDEARRVLGRGPIALSTVKENRAAVRLYQKLGFATESEMVTWLLPVS